MPRTDNCLATRHFSLASLLVHRLSATNLSIGTPSPEFGRRGWGMRAICARRGWGMRAICPRRGWGMRAVRIFTIVCYSVTINNFSRCTTSATHFPDPVPDPDSVPCHLSRVPWPEQEQTDHFANSFSVNLLRQDVQLGSAQ
jgi:hypothetical protein